MKHVRRVYVLVLGVIFVLGFTLLQSADARPQYPVKPIQVIVVYPPGGDTDVSARIWAGFVQKIIGQPVVVVNKAGAGGLTGIAFAADAKPVGDTILCGAPGAQVVAPHVSKAEFSVDSFVSIARVTVHPGALAVHVDSPWKTLNNFIQDAKKNPGKLSLGSCGSVASNTLLYPAIRKTSGDTTEIRPSRWACACGSESVRPPCRHCFPVPSELCPSSGSRNVPIVN